MKAIHCDHGVLLVMPCVQCHCRTSAQLEQLRLAARAAVAAWDDDQVDGDTFDARMVELQAVASPERQRRGLLGIEGGKRNIAIAFDEHDRKLPLGLMVETPVGAMGAWLTPLEVETVAHNMLTLLAVVVSKGKAN